MAKIRCICEYCGIKLEIWAWGESISDSEKCKKCNSKLTARNVRPERMFDAFGYNYKPKEDKIEKKDVFGYNYKS